MCLTTRGHPVNLISMLNQSIKRETPDDRQHTQGRRRPDPARHRQRHRAGRCGRLAAARGDRASWPRSTKARWWWTPAGRARHRRHDRQPARGQHAAGGRAVLQPWPRRLQRRRAVVAGGCGAARARAPARSPMPTCRPAMRATAAPKACRTASMRCSSAASRTSRRAAAPARSGPDLCRAAGAGQRRAPCPPAMGAVGDRRRQRGVVPARVLYGSAAVIDSIPNIGTPFRTLRDTCAGPARWSARPTCARSR